MLSLNGCCVNTRKHINQVFTDTLYLFHVVPCVAEDGVDDVMKKMAAPEEDNQRNEDITNNEPSACDSFV